MDSQLASGTREGHDAPVRRHEDDDYEHWPVATAVSDRRGHQSLERRRYWRRTVHTLLNACLEMRLVLPREHLASTNNSAVSEIFVIDQNVMQRRALPEFIATHRNAHFVLPDTALVEMCKSDQWEYTFRRNFAPLVPVVSRCLMSLSVQEAMELELKHKTCSKRRLLPLQFRILLRGAIAGSQLPDGNKTMHKIKRGIDQVRKDLKDNDLNASIRRSEIQGRIDEIRKKVAADDLKACRNASTARAARTLLGQRIGDSIYQAHMQKLNVPLQVAARLRRQKSMTLRWTYMLAHHALQWVGDGGFESATDATILNDALDQDYVLIGSFFNGLVSHEADVRNALLDLAAMLELPQSPVSYS